MSLSFKYVIRGGFVIIVFLWAGCVPSAAVQGVEPVPVIPQATTTYHNYDGLAELLTLICDDVMVQMAGFFGPTVVDVEPFIAFGQYQDNKISSLGITLADQMIAMVNNDTLRAEDGMSDYSNEYKQKIRGSLQEVDGYLHIHISAANVYGKRISYTTNVEMSEPIYRALHTYL